MWRAIFEALSQECEDALIFIDASIVKAHRAAAGSKREDWKNVLAAHKAVAQARFTRLQAPKGARCDWKSAVVNFMTAR